MASASFECDYSLVVIEEVDIDDPCVHVDLENLPNYDRNHLISWLKYRGDNLKSLDNMKSIRTRVLWYFKNGTDKNLVDPTLDLKWKKAKVAKYNIFVPQLPKLSVLNVVPDILKHDIGDIQSLDGWSKDLTNMPTFTIQHIDYYYDKVNSAFSHNATRVEKHFQRGAQLLEESFIDLNSIVIKEDDNLFCIKAVCAASMKNVNRWITVAINKAPVEVFFAYCQCAAGKPGICSHAFALLKLVAKWAIEKPTHVPTPVACTSRPCVWSVVQSRGRVIKSAVADLTISAPKQRKVDENNKSKGIKSTLYDARSSSSRVLRDDKLHALMSSLEKENSSIPALVAVNVHAQTVPTQFGEMPLGSVLSVHSSLIPPDFNVHCSSDLPASLLSEFYSYPPFPFVEAENVMATYLMSILPKKRKFVDSLKISKEDVHRIEQSTRMQVDVPEWFDLRKYRLTASLNNKICNIKTEKGLKKLASDIATKPTPSNYLMYKLNFGRYHEPIALQQYEKFMKMKQHYVQVENIGLVIDHKNYIFGATPDGKVVDPAEPTPYGIIEIKCSEEYKNNDPYDICYISKSSCLEIVDRKIYLKKSHSYYDQVQMQLALTTQSWCDFVLYTNKGMVIDRIRYNESHWFVLREKLLQFYFDFLLDEYILVDSQPSV